MNISAFFNKNLRCVIAYINCAILRVLVSCCYTCMLHNKSIISLYQAHVDDIWSPQLVLRLARLTYGQTLSGTIGFLVAKLIHIQAVYTQTSQEIKSTIPLEV